MSRLNVGEHRVMTLAEDFLRACQKPEVSRLQLWESILDILQPKAMLEIGVWKGEFSRYVLAKCKSIDIYFMVDPWRKLPDWNKPANVDDDAFEAIYREAVTTTNFASSKRKILRGRTVDVIDQIKDQSLDFVYIDGDHTLRGITTDLLSVWSKVKLGGYVGGDDLFANIWHHPQEYEPTLVFPFVVHFAEAMGVPVYALSHNQFLIEKRQREGRDYAFHDLIGRYNDLTLRRQMTSVPNLWNKLVSAPVKCALNRLTRLTTSKR